MKKAEVFKTVVSNGRRFDEYLVSSHGNIYSLKSKRLLKPEKLRRGHLRICLYENGKFQRLIHRIVLETFVGQPGPDQECCHGDGDPKNNNLDNLRWDSKSANSIDMSYHRAHHQQKLSVEDVLEIKKLLDEGNLTQTEIAEKYGVFQTSISQIKTGRNWGHLKVNAK